MGGSDRNGSMDRGLTMAEKTKHTANSTELVPFANPTAVQRPTT